MFLWAKSREAPWRHYWRRTARIWPSRRRTIRLGWPIRWDC
jgi:hypothetical protein